jgi:hypothetical protein
MNAKTKKSLKLKLKQIKGLRLAHPCSTHMSCAISPEIDPVAGKGAVRLFLCNKKWAITRPATAQPGWQESMA